MVKIIISLILYCSYSYGEISKFDNGVVHAVEYGMTLTPLYISPLSKIVLKTCQIDSMNDLSIVLYELSISTHRPSLG